MSLFDRRREEEYRPILRQVLDGINKRPVPAAILAEPQLRRSGQPLELYEFLQLALCERQAGPGQKLVVNPRENTHVLQHRVGIRSRANGTISYVNLLFKTHQGIATTEAPPQSAVMSAAGKVQ
jgi:hypothetical protein